MSLKSSGIRVERVETIPADATVRHVDELDEEVIHHLPELVSAGDGSGGRIVDRTVVEVLEDCDWDIVKFTDFYRIERA